MRFHAAPPFKPRSEVGSAAQAPDHTTLHHWPSPVVTGHQPWLWHPGILAKYLAADAAMPDTATPLRHVVVDQDTQDALRLALPVVENQSLRIHHTSLGRCRIDIPTGCQPPAELSLNNLPHGIAVDVSPIQKAIGSIGTASNFSTLAEQVTALLSHLMRPYLTRPLEPFYATRFSQNPWFADEIDRLLHDAMNCVVRYNAAAGRDPGAGIAPLVIEPYRVEMPLWALGWMKPRRRVYVDLADTKPIFTDETGEIIDPNNPDVTFAPRALLMTAWIRRQTSTGTFVHGTGGGRYDKITDQWWQSWRNESLNPLAVATADVYLDFDPDAVPVADSQDLQQAIWHRHHLPHNLDRHLQLAGPLVEEKARLLEHMDDDRDKPRRAVAFARIHEINQQLAEKHPQAVHEAEQDLHRTRIGVRNAATARRRDWPFALYPPDKLNMLREQINACVT